MVNEIFRVASRQIAKALYTVESTPVGPAFRAASRAMGATQLDEGCHDLPYCTPEDCAFGDTCVEAYYMCGGGCWGATFGNEVCWCCDYECGDGNTYDCICVEGCV